MNQRSFNTTYNHNFSFQVLNEKRPKGCIFLKYTELLLQLSNAVATEMPEPERSIRLVQNQSLNI